MKKIEKGTIKHLIILILAIFICGMIIYPIFDFILCKFITNSKFIYSFKSYVVQPFSAAVITGTILWILDKKQSN